MNKRATLSWIDEALDAIQYHEDRRAKCEKLGSIAISRAHKHSRMHHGILYVHNLAVELLEENKQLRKQLSEYKPNGQSQTKKTKKRKSRVSDV